MLKFNCMILSVVLITSCSTSLTHERLGDKAPSQPMFSYYLPMQSYTISVDYELLSCQPQPLVRQTATVVEENLPDKDEQYFLTFATLNSPMKTTTFTAANYPNQTLKSIGATVEDRAGVVAKNVLTAALTVAKLVLLKTAIPCTSDVSDRLTTAGMLRAKLLDGGVIGNERAAIIDALDKVRMSLTERVTHKFVPRKNGGETQTSIFGLSEDQLRRWFSNWPMTGEDPEFDQRVSSQIAVEPIGLTGADATLFTSGSKKGIVYRDPLPARVKVCAGVCASDAQVIGEAVTQIAQLGRHMVMSLDNGAFDKNTLTLTFAPGGALESMEHGEESRLERATGALSDTASQISELVQSRREAEQAQREAEASAELKAIQAETALLNAKADRIEARRRLTGLDADEQYEQ